MPAESHRDQVKNSVYGLELKKELSFTGATDVLQTPEIYLF